MRRFSILAAALAALALSGAAQAIVCYTVLDRSDSTIYRDARPPFDMSEAGAAERDAMRARGEYLTIADADRCEQITAPPGTTGYQPATVDEIVSGIMPYGAGARLSTPSNRGGGTARPAAAPAATRSGSSGMRTY